MMFVNSIFFNEAFNVSFLRWLWRKN